MYGDKHPRLGYPNSANDVEQLTDYLQVLKGFFNAKDPMVLSMEVTWLRVRTMRSFWQIPNAA